MKKILTIIILNVFVLAQANTKSGAKSHSVDLLHWGRHVPISLDGSSLITANSFVTSKSREVNVYNISDKQEPSKIQRIFSPYPLPGDDFGYSLDHNDNFMVIGSPGYDDGHGSAFIFKKDEERWVFMKMLSNPNIKDNERPQKFGYNVALNNDIVTISTPFFNDGMVHIFNINSDNLNPIHTVDVRKLGDVPGCYEEGPTKFGFGITTSINDNYLLIGSLKDYVYLVDLADESFNGIEILFPLTLDDDERVRFGESVFLGDESIYISSLGLNNNRGAVFKFDQTLGINQGWFLSDTINPVIDLDDIHFGFRLAEHENDVYITSFNDWKVHRFSTKNNKLIFRDLIENNLNNGSNPYHIRNIVSNDKFLVSDSYYDEKIFLQNLTENNSVKIISTHQPRESIREKIPCNSGYAGSYQCNDIDLMSFLDKTDIGGINSTILNDIWGWTDDSNGKEYALVGMSNGTSFVDISNPVNPIYIGRLPTQTSNSTWRDIKVYQNHAFIVSEASGHGMQIFDLKILRNYDGSSPQIFSNTAYYNGFGNAHNIFINEDTGFAYAIGTSTCGGGLHIVDIGNPTNPIYSACIRDPATGRSFTGYVHDVQCVIYNGPDSAYVGKEICFGSNETYVWITDVSQKTNDNSGAKTISLGSYNDYYTHQGWLTEDHKYLIVNDELDENSGATSGKTRTLIWDVQDLDNPSLFRTYYGPNASIDHNNYVVGDEVYMSHYSSGLRVLDISDIANPTEKAFFDVHPSNNNVNFDGSWSNYPFFDSKNIIVTAIDDGLFVVKKSVNLVAPTLSVSVPEDGSVLLGFQFNDSNSEKIKIYRSTIQSFTPSQTNLLVEISRSTTSYLDTNLDTGTTYYYKALTVSGSDQSPISDEVQVLPVILPNAQPTIDYIPDLSINEDIETSITLTGVSYGNDINSQLVNVSVTAEDINLIQNLTVNVDPSDDSKYNLTITPKDNMFGETIIVVVVSDNGGTEDGGIDHIEVYFNLTINSVNDAPLASVQIGELIISSNEYLYESVNGLNRFLSIDKENLSDSLRFEWSESLDVDGDDVSYRLLGYEDLSFLSMEDFASENYKTWAFKDIVSQLQDPLQILSGYWRVEATDGSITVMSDALNGKLFIDGIGLIPEEWGIKQSYPNPFLAFTTIEYDVPSDEKIVIKIYNLKGQAIKTLVNQEVSAGYQTVIWDGTNDSGDEVSSGIYFCQIFTPNSTTTKFKKAIKLTKLR